MRLKSVLGTREGFEKPTPPQMPAADKRRPDFEVIEGGPDRDITDYVAEGSSQADALAAMKKVRDRRSRFRISFRAPVAPMR